MREVVWRKAYCFYLLACHSRIASDDDALYWKLKECFKANLERKRKNCCCRTKLGGEMWVMTAAQPQGLAAARCLLAWLWTSSIAQGGKLAQCTCGPPAPHGVSECFTLGLTLQCLWYFCLHFIPSSPEADMVHSLLLPVGINLPVCSLEAEIFLSRKQLHMWRSLLIWPSIKH